MSRQRFLPQSYKKLIKYISILTTHIEVASDNVCKISASNVLINLYKTLLIIGYYTL